MEIVKTVEASERQINYIKHLLNSTQTRLIISNDELNDIDFKTAKSLIRALRKDRNHEFIHPDCRSNRFINLQIMEKSSSKEKEITLIQNALLKCLYKEGKITGEQLNTTKNSLDAYHIIKNFFNNEETKMENNFTEMIKVKKSRGIKMIINDEQKTQIRKKYLEERKGSNTIAKELSIPIHRVLYFLQSEKIIRSKEEYVKSEEFKNARKLAFIKAKEMRENGTMKYNSKKVNIIEKNIQSQYSNEKISIKINGHEISGNVSDVARLMKELK